MISPHSKSNCAYTAIAITLNWRKTKDILTDHIKQNQAGADIKRRKVIRGDKESKEKYATLEMVEKIVNVMKTNVIIYDNMFKVLKHIEVEGAT